MEDTPSSSTDSDFIPVDISPKELGKPTRPKYLCTRCWKLVPRVFSKSGKSHHCKALLKSNNKKLFKKVRLSELKK